MNKVYLKHSVVPKIRRFTPWVYANEIDSNKDEFQSGEIVALFSKKDGFLGTAYVNPKSAIFARILSFVKEEIVKKFFHNRIKNAGKPTGFNFIIPECLFYFRQPIFLNGGVI